MNPTETRTWHDDPLVRLALERSGWSATGDTVGFLEVLNEVLNEFETKFPTVSYAEFLRLTAATRADPSDDLSFERAMKANRKIRATLIAGGMDPSQADEMTGLGRVATGDQGGTRSTNGDTRAARAVDLLRRGIHQKAIAAEVGLSTHHVSYLAIKHGLTRSRVKMPQVIQEAAEAYLKAGNQKAAARLLGVQYGTFRHRLMLARAQGLLDGVA